mmetsp:Transcript_16930/g.38081  ORF Transcript_16930/g.38081 Transcript_16930/m.38081 type:complete len:259 (-) Transcript_16930:537-1313(-)
MPKRHVDYEDDYRDIGIDSFDDTLSKGISKGTSYVKKTARRIQDLATRGPLSFRVLAYLGGLAMAVTSAFDMISQFTSFHPVNTLVAFYTLLLGIVIVLLEGKQFSCPTYLVRGIHYYAKFLEYIWGRGCLYFFAGTLQIVRPGLVNTAVGGFLCFVGVTAFVAGRNTASKLNRIRRCLGNEAAVQSEFIAMDRDGDGHLSPEEFNDLAINLGLDLDHNELSVAIALIDTDGNGKISFSEFYAWWESWDDGPEEDLYE